MRTTSTAPAASPAGQPAAEDPLQRFEAEVARARRDGLDRRSLLRVGHAAGDGACPRPSRTNPYRGLAYVQLYLVLYAI